MLNDILKGGAAMVPFEVLPCIEVGGLVGLYLRSDLPIERKVADALIRLMSCPSSDWEQAMKLAKAERVSVELSLEQLALVLEQLDFSSGESEDIAGMVFWAHARAAMEFLETLGYGWTNELGFDCHESYVIRWWVPEGMVGYLLWLVQRGATTARLPEEFRYVDLSRKQAAPAKGPISALDQHVNQLV
jgi:hypothetical protein